MYLKIKSNAFSFTQFLVVVAIVGILAAIAIPAYGEYTSRTKALKMLSDIKDLQSAVTSYRAINGKFMPISEAKEFKEIYGVDDPVETSPVISKMIFKTEGKDKIIISIIGGGHNLSLREGQSLQLDLFGTWIQETGVEWICQSKGQTKIAPAFCKPYEVSK